MHISRHLIKRLMAVFVVILTTSTAWGQITTKQLNQTSDFLTLQNRVSVIEALRNGSVTSVGISPPPIFSAGSAITTAGNLSFSLNSQTQNNVFAAPSTGNGVPTFRTLVPSDIPILNQNTTGTASNVTGVVGVANGGTGVSGANQIANRIFASPSGATGAASFRALTTSDIPTVLPTLSSINVSGTGSFGSLVGAVGSTTSTLTDAGAINRTQNNRNADVTRITDFCSSTNLNGTTDNTTCIQAAVTAMCSRVNAGGTLYFPAQYQYAINANASGGYAITIPCSGLYITGDGWGDDTHGGKTTLINMIGSGSSYAFIWAVPSAQRRAGAYGSGGGVRDLEIHSVNTASSVTQTGAMIDFEHCEGCITDHVRLWAPYIGVRIFSGLENRITQSQINQVVPGGIGIIGIGSDSGCSSLNCGGRNDVMLVDHTILDASFGNGSTSQPDCIVARDFMATVQISSVVCNQFRRGFYANCPTSTLGVGACPAFVSMFDFENEANDENVGDGANIWLEDVQHFICVDCQLFGYSVVNNVAVANNRFAGTGDVQFIGGRIGGAKASCVVSSADVTFFGSGIEVDSCGQSGSGYYAFDLRGPTMGVTPGSQTVSGANLCRVSNTSSTANFGAVALSTNTDYNVVTNNRLRGCLSGVTDNSGGTHNVISGNTGI